MAFPAYAMLEGTGGGVPAAGLELEPASANYVSVSRSDKFQALVSAINGATLATTQQYSLFGTVTTTLTLSAGAASKGVLVEPHVALPAGSWIISLRVKHMDSGLPSGVSINMPQGGTNTIITKSAGVNSGNWETISAAFTTLSTINANAWGIWVFGALGESGSIQFDGFQVEPSVNGAATSYINGDMGNGYSWVGTAWLSESIRSLIQTAGNINQPLYPNGGIIIPPGQAMRNSTMARADVFPELAGITYPERGINIRNYPYLCKGDGVTDDTLGIRAALMAALPSNENQPITLGTTVYLHDITTNAPTTPTVATATAELATLPACVVVGATVQTTLFVPAGLNGTFTITAVSGNTFQFTVPNNTASATGWGKATILTGNVTGTSLSGQALTITFANNLPPWILGPSSNPGLVPGSAIQLTGTWTVNGVSIANTGGNAGTWYTVQSLPAANQVVITIPAGLSGTIVSGTVVAWGILPAAGSDSGILNTPTQVLLTSTNPTTVRRSLVAPSGDYAVQPQGYDAPNTAVFTLYETLICGAGMAATYFTALASPGGAVPRSGVPIFDLYTNDVGVNNAGLVACRVRFHTPEPASYLHTGTVLQPINGVTFKRPAILSPTVVGGVIQSPVTIVDGGLGYSGTPTMLAYSDGVLNASGSYTITVSGGVVTSVTTSGTSGFSSTITPRVPWACCDGVRMNSPCLMEGVYITQFDYGLVYNSLGGGIMVRGCQMTGNYANCRMFMDGGNDQTTDTQTNGAAFACYSFHFSTTRCWPLSATQWPAAVALVFRRIYSGTAPFGFYAEHGYPSGAVLQTLSEFHTFGFESVSVAAIFAADAAVLTPTGAGANNAGFAQVTFATPFTSNFDSPLAVGTLPELDYSGVGGPNLNVAATYAHLYMCQIGFVKDFLYLDHSWGFSNGGIAGWHINNVGSTGRITAKISSTVDATKLWAIESDQAASNNGTLIGAVRIIQAGRASAGTGKFASGTTIPAFGTPLTVSVQTGATCGYVQISAGGATVVDWTVIRVWQMSSGGLQKQSTLFGPAINTVTTTPPPSGGVGFATFTVQLIADPADAGLSSGHLQSDYNFGWEAI